MDDITVYSKTHESHHNDVQEVLELLSRNGLRIGRAKSVFCTTKVNLLGFSVCNGEVSPDESRLGPFKERLQIETIQQLHSFIGCIGYFRNFIEDFAGKTFELYEVINRKKAFQDVSVENLVENLRLELIESAFLALPEMEEPFVIESDASDYCIGGVLKQVRHNKEVVIRFCSRNLNKAERNYSTLERETLAIIFAVKTFKNYLYKKFTVRTDHKALVWLYNVKNPKGKMARWLMFLADLNFVIEYKEGKTNVVADCLSRLKVARLEVDMDADRNAVLEAHALTGHSCANNTYNFLRIHNANVGVTKDYVKGVLKACGTCLKFRKNRAFKQFPTIVDGTFLEVGIDCIGPLPKSSAGNRFIVLVTDYFSKWVEGKALKKKSAEEVARFLVEDVFSRHGTVKAIRSDQGLEFTNKLVNSVAQMWASRFKHSSPYHPQSNGLAERTNKTIIEKMSKAMVDYGQNWDKVLPYVLMQYRVGVIEKFNASPFMLLYGRKPNIPSTLLELPTDFDLYLMDPVEYMLAKQDELSVSGDIVREVNRNAVVKVEQVNMRKANPDDLVVGDRVLLRKHNSLLKKFETPYSEVEYRVTEVKGKGAYRIYDAGKGSYYDINRKDLVKVVEDETETERVLSYLMKGRVWTSV
jgi:transposase InsO family protein